MMLAAWKASVVLSTFYLQGGMGISILAGDLPSK